MEAHIQCAAPQRLDLPQLRSLKDEEMPLLYKYRSCSNEDELGNVMRLLRGEFWFPLARDVNDPFEFRCTVDYGSLDDDILRDTIKAFALVECRMNPQISREDAVKKVIGVFKKLKDDQIKRRQWELSFDLWRRFASEITMCCFSGTPTSTLLWSHYARGHTGVAIEVKPRGFVRCVTYPVKYTDEIAPFSPLALVDVRVAMRKKLFDILFLRKASCWDYEEEYRILLKKSAAHAHTFKPGSVRRIILGCAMPDDMKEKIVAWVRENTPTVDIAIAIPSSARSYSLTIEKL